MITVAEVESLRRNQRLEHLTLEEDGRPLLARVLSRQILRRHEYRKRRGLFRVFVISMSGKRRFVITARNADQWRVIPDVVRTPEPRPRDARPLERFTGVRVKW